MFEYEFQAIESNLIRASECLSEACKLPNPGSFWRTWQTALIDPSTGERRSEQQAQIDERRNELMQEAEDAVMSCKPYVEDIFGWFGDHGYDAERMYKRFSDQLGSHPSKSDIKNALSGLYSLQQIVDATERAEEEARQAEEELREAAQNAVEERGCSIWLEVK